MLQVDGHVIEPGELIRRVEELVGAARSQAGQLPTTGAALAAGDITDQVQALRALQEAVRPPEMGPRGGIRGWTASLVKRIVRRAAGWYVEPRWSVQRDFDIRTAEYAAQVHDELRRVTREVEAMRRQQLTLRMQLVSSFERAQALQGTVEMAVAEISLRAREVTATVPEPGEAAAKEDVEALRRDVLALAERLGVASGEGVDLDYVGFENRFRGDSESLKENQRRYLTLFPHGPGRILDVGCGRGEMLELLTEAGHDAFGVDSDPGMVAECMEKGLPVVEDNALQLLERLQDGTLKGVFCAQVVEHLLVSELQRFVQLAFAKLQPGGVAVIETINPRSSFALGEHFYADPSHVRPVHPETLRFICEQIGFSSVQLEERSPHPAVGLIDRIPADDHVGEAVGTLLRGVFGFQDYAIVATK